MLTHEYIYAYGAVDACTGELDSLILPQVNTGCMQLFLNEVSRRRSNERIVRVVDGAGWHRSGLLKAPSNIYLLKLPPYAPELNPIEHVWDELREKFFSTIGSLPVLMRWKTNSYWVSKPWSRTLKPCVLLTLGIGLLVL